MGKRLLLGTTPELRKLAAVAVDSDPVAVKNRGPGVELGDWRALPFDDASFDAVIGDGCLNIFEGDPAQFFLEMRRVLRPNGRLILRVFISTEVREPLERVLEEKDRQGFHAFKWRVAMSLANPLVAVKDIYDTIAPVWPHPTLEVYRGSPAVYYFPCLRDLPTWTRIRFSHSYELSERCPILTWTY